MTRRRIAIVLAVATASLAGLALPGAQAAEVPNASLNTATWACVSNDLLKVGACLSNPF